MCTTYLEMSRISSKLFAHLSKLLVMNSKDAMYLLLTMNSKDVMYLLTRDMTLLTRYEHVN